MWGMARVAVDAAAEHAERIKQAAARHEAKITREQRDLILESMRQHYIRITTREEDTKQSKARAVAAKQQRIAMKGLK